ncbi:transcriptional corepressor SEUSS-like isoform X6 [Hibiscus syriacus]|uniref:Transcriptional corepressor SEUSS-like isoform X6 n=1 Tax=Hibiscus syriacus TaxID=106335 RepID=A0A6A3AZ26_HIBSY|nr:transcriptional corepressor SEUSS-like isoform X6 [Hibiscus syriacus]
MQFRQQLQQQGMQQVAGMKCSFDGGVCAHRLMQYLYHQRQRPPDNTFACWRKCVAEYYSPRAKKRWCLPLYDNAGSHALGAFPQAAMDAWHCDICGSKSGRGFGKRFKSFCVVVENTHLEATFEVLPRLNEIKFGSGVVDELLFLDLPRESRFPSGIMMLEYGKAVQESVLAASCCKPVTSDSTEVCQSTISEDGSEGVSQQDLQTKSNIWLEKLSSTCQCSQAPLANAQGLPTDRNTLNKLMALHPGISNPLGSSQQQMLEEFDEFKPLINQEASSSFNNPNQSPSSIFQGPATVSSGSMQILPLYHEMSNKNTGVQQQQQQSVSGQNGNASSGRNGLGFGNNTTAQPAAATSIVSGGAAGPAPSRSNSFKCASNSDSSAAGGNAGFKQRAPDLPQSLHLQDDIVWI